MNDQISNNVREYRGRKGVTQETLAEAVGVSRQTIIAIEKGHYTPSLPLAINIAKYFRQRVEELFKLKN